MMSAGEAILSAENRENPSGCKASLESPLEELRALPQTLYIWWVGTRCPLSALIFGTRCSVLLLSFNRGPCNVSSRCECIRQKEKTTKII